ncbi:MAG: hypothetical protein KJ880_06435 [Candidatus Omnitrophica bacterium]|nr:hypothetical protein [Candidatus Omnitrophota bacterium]MBU1869513.1 hypothetical protein [Candidatus Omnitrophota bacterium]
MKNKKLRSWVLGCGFIIFTLCFSGNSFAEDADKIAALQKQIDEAKSKEQVCLALDELKDLYFKEDRYSDFTDFLNALSNKKKDASVCINYCNAVTRYQQLKYLEEKQNWDEYFSNGNTYRDQITSGIKNVVDNTSAKEAINVYARLLIWRFHQDQQDNLTEQSLTDLMDAAVEYSKEASDLSVVKDAADQLFAYGEKAKARQLYKIYADKLIASDINDETLGAIAFNFYKEGNLELSEVIYDAYIDKASKALPKEKLFTSLLDIAKHFAYKDSGASDPSFAEKVFNRMQGLGLEGSLDEELMYLRAYNLEKMKDFSAARNVYAALVKAFPKTSHYDEAVYKSGIISCYALRDAKTGKGYFTALANKDILTPQVISSLYQLGLLAQWEADQSKARQYYTKLLEKAGASFGETAAMAKERIKEIDDNKPMEYNIKTFLDLSLKEELANADMSKLELKAAPYLAKKSQEIYINSAALVGSAGCTQVELQYLWSGQLGKTKPAESGASLNTSYGDAGTKEINLIVVSPTGIIDRNIDFVDVF